MVDQVGWKATAPLAKATATAVQPTPVRPAPAPASDTVATAGLARQLAAGPPVDTDRVARIKKAIADGSFPILPSTIADRLLALRLEWNPNDKT